MRLSDKQTKNLRIKFNKRAILLLLGSFLACLTVLAAEKSFVLPDPNTPKGTTQPIPQTPPLSTSPTGIAPPTAAASTVDSLTNLPIRVLGPGIFQLGKVRMDKNTRTVSFPSVLNMREGPMEYFLVTEYGKKHESVLRTDAEPYHIHMAMLFLNAKGGSQMPKPLTVPTPGAVIDQTKNEPLSHPSLEKLPGDRVTLEMKWMQDGKEVRKKTEDMIASTAPKSSGSKLDWHYTGSRIVNRVFLCQLLGNIGSLVTDPDALLNNEGPGHDDDHIWTTKPENLPPVGTPVEVTILFSDKEKK